MWSFRLRMKRTGLLPTTHRSSSIFIMVAGEAGSTPTNAHWSSGQKPRVIATKFCATGWTSTEALDLTAPWQCHYIEHYRTLMSRRISSSGSCRKEPSKKWLAFRHGQPSCVGLGSASTKASYSRKRHQTTWFALNKPQAFDFVLKRGGSSRVCPQGFV